MVKRENNFWKRLSCGMATDVGCSKIRMQRIESSTLDGIPDVAYSARFNDSRKAGWIELKRIVDYPKRPGTPIRIHHLTDEQRLFIWLHGRITRSVYLFVQIKNDYYLFDHTYIDDVGLTLTKSDWQEKAVKFWKGKCDWWELFRILLR